jgi:hypothetical protein
MTAIGTVAVVRVSRVTDVAFHSQANPDTGVAPRIANRQLRQNARNVRPHRFPYKRFYKENGGGSTGGLTCPG